MSKSNASAKNRRAFAGNPPPPPQSVSSTQYSNTIQSNSSNVAQPSGFTLPQVIAVIDNRLLNLERFMKESKEQKHVHFDEVRPNNDPNPIIMSQSDDSVNEVLAEFSNRFDMIAEEVANLKDIVLKLQSYTMDVNKTLLEERIHILSDLGSTNQPIENQTFEISNDPSALIESGSGSGSEQ